MKYVSILALLLTSCTTPRKEPFATLDVYIEDEGFFVIAEQSTGESMAVRLNVYETHKR